MKTTKSKEHIVDNLRKILSRLENYNFDSKNAPYTKSGKMTQTKEKKKKSISGTAPTTKRLTHNGVKPVSKPKRKKSVNKKTFSGNSSPQNYSESESVKVSSEFELFIAAKSCKFMCDRSLLRKMFKLWTRQLSIILYRKTTKARRRENNGVTGTGYIGTPKDDEDYSSTLKFIDDTSNAESTLDKDTAMRISGYSNFNGISLFDGSSLAEDDDSTINLIYLLNGIKKGNVGKRTPRENEDKYSPRKMMKNKAVETKQIKKFDSSGYSPSHSKNMDSCSNNASYKTVKRPGVFGTDSSDEEHEKVHHSHRSSSFDGQRSKKLESPSKKGVCDEPSVEEYSTIIKDSNDLSEMDLSTNDKLTPKSQKASNSVADSEYALEIDMGDKSPIHIQNVQEDMLSIIYTDLEYDEVLDFKNPFIKNSSQKGINQSDNKSNDAASKSIIRNSDKRSTDENRVKIDASSESKSKIIKSADDVKSISASLIAQRTDSLMNTSEMKFTETPQEYAYSVTDNVDSSDFEKVKTPAALSGDEDDDRLSVASKSNVLSNQSTNANLNKSKTSKSSWTLYSSAMDYAEDSSEKDIDDSSRTSMDILIGTDSERHSVSSNGFSPIRRQEVQVKEFKKLELIPNQDPLMSTSDYLEQFEADMSSEFATTSEWEDRTERNIKKNKEAIDKITSSNIVVKNEDIDDDVPESVDSFENIDASDKSVAVSFDIESQASKKADEKQGSKEEDSMGLGLSELNEAIKHVSSNSIALNKSYQSLSKSPLKSFSPSASPVFRPHHETIKPRFVSKDEYSNEGNVGSSDQKRSDIVCNTSDSIDALVSEKSPVKQDPAIASHEDVISDECEVIVDDMETNQEKGVIIDQGAETKSRTTRNGENESASSFAMLFESTGTSRASRATDNNDVAVNSEKVSEGSDVQEGTGTFNFQFTDELNNTATLSNTYNTELNGSAEQKSHSQKLQEGASSFLVNTSEIDNVIKEVVPNVSQSSATKTVQGDQGALDGIVEDSIDMEIAMEEDGDFDGPPEEKKVDQDAFDDDFISVDLDISD